MVPPLCPAAMLPRTNEYPAWHTSGLTLKVSGPPADMANPSRTLLAHQGQEPGRSHVGSTCVHAQLGPVGSQAQSGDCMAFRSQGGGRHAALRVNLYFCNSTGKCPEGSVVSLSCREVQGPSVGWGNRSGRVRD